jgi:hypothetical protein
MVPIGVLRKTRDPSRPLAEANAEMPYSPLSVRLFHSTQTPRKEIKPSFREGLYLSARIDRFCGKSQSQDCERATTRVAGSRSLRSLLADHHVESETFSDNCRYGTTAERR